MTDKMDVIDGWYSFPHTSPSNPHVHRGNQTSPLLHPLWSMPPIDSSAPGGGGNGVVIPLISSWLHRTRRGPRYIILLVCSPILLPFLCFSFPLICLAELCIRVFRRCRRRKGGDGDMVERQRGDIEEAEGVEILQRYLDDQLRLVRSVYECGQEDEDGFRDFDFLGPGQRPLLHS